MHRLRDLVGHHLDGDLPRRVLRGELDGAAGGDHVRADLGGAAEDLERHGGRLAGGQLGVETVKVIGVVVPAGPEPSVTAASETDSGSTSSSCSVTVPVASPIVAFTGADSSTVSASSGSTLVSPTTDRCSTVFVSPAGIVATPCAAA